MTNKIKTLMTSLALAGVVNYSSAQDFYYGSSGLLNPANPASPLSPLNPANPANPINLLSSDDSPRQDKKQMRPISEQYTNNLVGVVFNETGIFWETERQTKTFNFDLLNYRGVYNQIKVRESPSRSYRQLMNEVRNIDHVSITPISVTKNSETGEVLYYEVDSDQIKVLKRTK